MVPLPAPDGPSIAMMRRVRASQSRCYYPPACDGVDAQPSLAGIAIFAVVVSRRWLLGRARLRSRRRVRGPGGRDARDRADASPTGETGAGRRAAARRFPGAPEPLPARQISAARRVGAARCCSSPASTPPASTNRGSMRFARDLASMGHPVVTVGPPDLTHYSHHAGERPTPSRTRRSGCRSRRSSRPTAASA